MGKALEAAVTLALTEQLETRGLLAKHHYGGCANHNTTDPLLILTQTIKDAWQVKQVASILYLDVSATFPNVSHVRLIDCMRDMGLHETPLDGSRAS